MKELLLQYAKYNMWANKRIIDVLLKLEDGQYNMEIVSSFPTIKQTALHSWSAEQVWLERLLLKENPLWVQDSFNGPMAEICDGWQKVSENLMLFISKQFDDRAFEHVVEYYSLKKQTFKTPVHIVLMQAFNHATYHRGQLITMLRQAGVKKIPNTDLITFSRDKHGA